MNGLKTALILCFALLFSNSTAVFAQTDWSITFQVSARNIVKSGEFDLTTDRIEVYLGSTQSFYYGHTLNESDTTFSVELNLLEVLSGNSDDFTPVEGDTIRYYFSHAMEEGENWEMVTKEEDSFFILGALGSYTEPFELREYIAENNTVERNVTFNVDMSVQIAKDLFDTNEHRVFAFGNFNNWSDLEAHFELTNNGSNVYTGTFLIEG